MTNTLHDIDVISSIDASVEKNLFYYPEGKTNVPLAVVLHTWSFDRHNQKGLLGLCEERGWALLCPEFRGSNKADNPRAPQACGSTLARQDVIDAIDVACKDNSIDGKHIFLFGGSGGGHMALMMAAYKPSLWAAVSSWCPITSIKKWHGYYGAGNGYAVHMEACCGGVPGTNDEVDKQYSLRSPMSYLDELMDVRLFIHHGRADMSVPYSHTLDIAMALEAKGHKKLFFEIFDGGHEMHGHTAFEWFDRIYNKATQEELTG